MYLSIFYKFESSLKSLVIRIDIVEDISTVQTGIRLTLKDGIVLDTIYDIYYDSIEGYYFFKDATLNIS